MKFTTDEFRAWKNKKVTLLGMSGVGKTYLSSMLRDSQWFHFSGDYRIGTRYLDEPILDMIKQQAMKVPFLNELLKNDWIYIRNNIKVHDLGPVLSFVGQLGNPESGGVELDDFIKRQAQYREAEVATMFDVPRFIEKAQNIYGYDHFVNDVGGSLCELDEPGVIETLAEHTLILYIQVTNREEENKLIQRAQSAPKPLYYRAEFLQQQLTVYLKENGLQYAAQMEPDDFTRWIFPHLFHSRIPRYEAIAKQGYTVTSEEVAQLKNESDFLKLLETAILRQS
ncbi:ATPases of the AAA+ class [hydrothermal vent metagenome]|uniref:ATPases of the AAA+ class n=1 Tax=hydrothermal vent metagenome TaxID=652676 RepID=A0A3B0XL59_9ZZZZ